MRRLVVIPAIIAGLMSLSMPTAWASGPDTARVEGLRGGASVRVSSSASWQSLEGTLEVGAGSTLRTDQGGEALVSLPGNVVLRVAPGSELEVSRLAGQDLSLELQSGRLFASVPAQERGGLNLQIQTPAGLAVSSGAEFTVDAGQKTAVRVISGSAQLSGEHVTVAGVSGQALEVPAGTAAVAANTPVLLAHNADTCNCTDPNCPCQNDPAKCNTSECTTWAAAHPPGQGGGGGGGGTFPVFGLLGGLGLLGLVVTLISTSSEVQSQ